MEDFLQNTVVQNLLDKVKVVRIKTEKLIESLEIDDLVVQTANFVSPIKWHLGHTSWFFEKFILAQFCKDYEYFNKSYDFIFNSYYETVSHFNLRKNRGSLSRPSLIEVIKYRKYIDDNLNRLRNINSKKLKNIIELAINHEQQHQELILMDIKNILFSNTEKPAFISSVLHRKIDQKIKKKNQFSLKKSIKTRVGNDGNQFCFDNESPSSIITLEPFYLSDFVTNEDWISFIEDKGYNRPDLWLSDGWEFIKSKKINKPMYWIDKNNLFSLNGVEKINMNSPVSHISFYEAMAFARYKNQNLPTEFELEYVLRQSKKSGNFLEENIFKECSYNSEEFFDSFFGNLWVWSSSPYLPYKNYKPYKDSLSEYNGKFMCNQYILKGGSFATPVDHIRASYRNFYYPSDRWQFVGLRLSGIVN